MGQRLIDNIETNDMNFKHLETTKDIVISPKNEYGDPQRPDVSHKWTAKVSDGTNYVGDYAVKISGASMVVDSEDFTKLPVGQYQLEIWEQWNDVDGTSQLSIYPSPQQTIPFRIYQNITDLAEKEIKQIGFQDVVDQAVMNIGMNYVFKVNTIEPDQTATVVQAAADGKNYVTFNIPRGAKGDPGVPGTPGIQGLPGKDGKTPVRGVDYWTDADQKAIQTEGQKYIDSTLAKMNLEPEAFENEAALKAKYPNGKPGLMITADTGHKWLYINGKWKDCGIYQTAGLAENAVKNMELVTPDQANDFDANTIAGNTVYRFLNIKGATDVTLNTPFGNVWGTDAVCLLLTIGKPAVPGTVQYFINTGDDMIYHRTHISDTTGAHWTAWKSVTEDELVSNPELITPSNSGSFDFNSAQNNSIVRILLDSNATIPAHAPFKTYPGGIGVLETWGAGLGAVQKYTQVYKDMAQDVSVWYRYKAKDWYSWYQANTKATNGNGKLRITVGVGKDFTKLKDAVEAAMSSTPANTEVVVYPGTYDLIQEFGEDYFTKISGGEMNGLMIGKGLTLTFLGGSHVTANYTGTNPSVMKGFSPFNACEGDIYIRGLDLTCSRVRYGFHDERADNPRPYITHLRDCHIYMDNTQNTAWLPRQCIGGGLGEHGTISIGRCSFESKDISGGVVTYHNGSTADCESTITIYDSYFGGSNHANVGFGYRGASTHATTINLFGNSWTSAPNVHPETPSETNVNMKLGKVFNNELR